MSVVTLSPRVRRITAPNPSVMTGEGTNTYLVGEREVAIIDPGPAIASHMAAIENACDGRAFAILCTHTHPDHSPAAAVLAERLGVPMYGATTLDDSHQDLTFKPERDMQHNDVHAGDAWTLRAIHTPGHVDNHFCFLLEEEGMVFAGDHIMNGTTVVIIPPSGDMAAYIASLQRLLDYPVTSIAPGHGELIPDCVSEVNKLVRHRLMREAKVVAGLADLGSADLDELVRVVYDDVPASLHEWAKLSMLAHLIKLRQETRAVADESGIWRPITDALA